MQPLRTRRDYGEDESMKTDEIINSVAARHAQWDNLPKGWTSKSVDSFWNTMVGDAKHKVTKCMKKMDGKIDDTGAFCASLADKVEGKGWRSEKRTFNQDVVDELVQISKILTSTE